jgi:hypothetical protein
LTSTNQFVPWENPTGLRWSIVSDVPRGKFLYDMVMARVGAQSTDLATMQGRSKDLIGLAAVTTTVTGVLSNDKLFNNVAILPHRPREFAVLLVVGLVLAILPGIYVLWPRAWFLAPDPVDLNAQIDAHPTWPVDAYYSSAAMGFIERKYGRCEKTNALRFNDRRLFRLRIAVVAQLVGVCGLAIAGLVLALQT